MCTLHAAELAARNSHRCSGWFATEWSVRGIRASSRVGWKINVFAVAAEIAP